MNERVSSKAEDGGLLALMDRLSVPQLLAELLARKRVLILAAAAGAVLGLIAAIVGTIRGAPASALVTIRENSAYANLLVPDVFSIRPESLLNRVTLELARRDNLAKVLDTFNAANPTVPLVASLSRLAMSPERIDVIIRREDDNGETEATGRNVAVSIKGVHPRLGMMLLDRLLALTQEQALTETIDERMAALKLEQDRLQWFLSVNQPQRRNKTLLEQELAALQGEVRKRRETQVVQLREALRVAEAAGIVKPALPDLMSSSMANSSVFDVRGAPLFLYGSEALREQIATLQARASDEHEEPRILDVRRDLEALAKVDEGRVLRVRGDRDPISESYSLAAQRLAVLKGVMQVQPGPAQILDIIRIPSRGSHSDLMNVLGNILRGFVLALVLAVLYVAGRFAVRAVAKNRATG